ncbi:MAG: LPP20 family lipoprotein [Kiritimatiellales bacterium]|nr:LPP20 family lipoprotein [Kiritimatiellales bacterium]
MRDARCGIRDAGFGILLLLLTGCASQSINSPAWLLSPQEKYPKAQYLVAVGEGDTRRAAENSAAAGLARIFESQIQAEETLSETTTEARGAIESFDQFSELRANIRIGSSQNLLNIQFGEAFTDRHGRVYTAAYLPRAETAEIYRTRIGENNRAITHLTHQSDAAADPLKKYAFRRAAVRKALKNDLLLAQLDIIFPGTKERLLLHYDPQTLYSETAAAARDVTFSIHLSGDGGDALREALTGMGFSENEKATLRFSGTVSFEETDLRRGTLVFVRYHYQLEARTGDGALVLALSGSRREGHINFSQATHRARRSLLAELQTQVPLEVGKTLDRLASAE